MHVHVLGLSPVRTLLPPRLLLLLLMLLLLLLVVVVMVVVVVGFVVVLVLPLAGLLLLLFVADLLLLVAKLLAVLPLLWLLVATALLLLLCTPPAACKAMRTSAAPRAPKDATSASPMPFVELLLGMRSCSTRGLWAASLPVLLLLLCSVVFTRPVLSWSCALLRPK
jgi:hypothetical protein